MLTGLEKVLELQQFLNEIYGEKNKELDVEVILARMIETVSDATSPFSINDNYHSIFVKTLSWYFAFCNRNGIDVQSSVIRRYPEACPKCFSESCVCERTRGFLLRARHLAGSPEEALSTRADRLLQQAKFAP